MHHLATNNVNTLQLCRYPVMSFKRSSLPNTEDCGFGLYG